MISWGAGVNEFAQNRLILEAKFGDDPQRFSEFLLFKNYHGHEQ